MKILVLAPHPYYTERGTPIAVSLLLRALLEQGHDLELLTFHLGRDETLPPGRIHRIRPWFPIRYVPPGLSLRKLICDFFMFWKFAGLMIRKRYDVVHAVEEASFMALVMCPLRSTPYIVDMDSLMTTQIVDRHTWLRPLRGVLLWFESLPIRCAAVVVPMCDGLADAVRRYKPKRMVVLRDVSMREGLQQACNERLRDIPGMASRIVMYVGNLESYQGIDLLLESFARLTRSREDVDLVVIGGVPQIIAQYENKIVALGVGERVHFLGPRPVSQLDGFLSQADVLVSPRLSGINTPMKLYSYLDSGVPVVATELPSHTQVMSGEIGLLAKPDKQSLAEAVARLLDDPALGERLAKNARAHIEREHSYDAYKSRVEEIYAHL